MSRTKTGQVEKVAFVVGQRKQMSSASAILWLTVQLSHILVNLTTPTITSGHTHFVMFPQYQPQSSRGGSGSLCGEMEGGPRLSASGSSVLARGGEEGMGS